MKKKLCCHPLDSRKIFIDYVWERRKEKDTENRREVWQQWKENILFLLQISILKFDELKIDPILCKFFRSLVWRVMTRFCHY